MAKITAGSAVKYIILPGIIPRIRELFFSGFGLLAFYVAMIYGKARLLPPTHPYLNQANIGGFGMRHAIYAAWRNLDFKLKNIDQILLFFAVLSGVLLVFVYIFAAFFYLVTAPAMAGGFNLLGGSMFVNAYPRDDIAFMMLDRMLGIPGIYNSRVVTTGEFGPMPNAFHHGLHALFAYFSWAMLAVAVIILLYFVVDIVLETTITGSPFGKHFDNPWVPIRIVFALGLLIPVSYGLNSAQWITLYVAKMGSNFATNGWIAFNRGMDNPLGQTNRELVSVPVTPDFVGLAKNIFTIRACKDIEQRLESDRRAAQDSAAGGGGAAQSSDSGEIVVIGHRSVPISAFFVDNDRSFKILNNNNRQPGKNWPEEYQGNYINLYLEGLRFYNGQDIKIVFGRYNEENINRFPGGVEPICGEILIPNMLPAGQSIPTGDATNADISDGLLIGSAHMFTAMKMIYSITKDGWGEDATGEELYNNYLMRAATDRYYYQETAPGRAKIQRAIAENAELGDDSFNASCPNDTDNDGFDDDGEERKFEELGPCEGPIVNQFFVNLAEKYQRYFSYAPIMGYDYYTGGAANVLAARCSAIDCGRVVSGARNTCERMLRTCNETRNGYSDSLPLPSVYYRDLGQPNPFTSNQSMNSDLFKYGWGGAGIWYKYIAEKNGGLISSTNTLPRLTHYPKLMETVAEQRAANDQNVSSGDCEKYNPAQSGNTPITLPSSVSGASEVAKIYYNLCKNLQENEHIKLSGTEAQKSGNPMLDMINVLFGTSHLFSFRENSAVNPMAQMVSLGRALLDKAIQNVMIATGGSALAGMASLFGKAAGGDAGKLLDAMGVGAAAFAKMMVGGATLSLTAGVLLFYVMPMLPFMYFFFAVGTWVKSVFEALVGVPLWALAHLRLDGGPSFAGKAATGGYFMLLEIFLRPIVTLIALMATFIIFNSLAYILNVTWGLVTNNLVGYDPYTQLSDNKLDIAYWRPKIDQFFFTICYIIFMYMLATSVFKLIDLIPDSVMRWIDGMKSFGSLDSSDQDVQAVSQTVALPTYIGVQKIAGSSVDMIYQVPSNIGGFVNEMREMSKPPSQGPGGQQ